MTTALLDAPSVESFKLRNLPIVELSTVERMALSSKADRRRMLDGLTEQQQRGLLWDWAVHARPDQMEPEQFAAFAVTVWIISAGRGYGKTRTGAETVRKRVNAGISGRIGIVAPTAGDARDVMIEGPSGIMNVHPDWERPKYEPSKRRITWPNGALATVYSADEPERLRGPEHDFVWGDEPASWRYGQEAWDNIELGLRIGDNPQAMLTGTPKPIKWLKELLNDVETVVTRGASYRNLANLAPTFIRRILKRYEGTRLGLQELHAILLEDVEGALWTRTLLDAYRVRWVDQPDGTQVLPIPDLDRVVVAVDPAGTSGPKSSETGIITVGRAGTVQDGQAYVLEDSTLRGTPTEWAHAVIDAYRMNDADAVVAEVNMGWDLVEANIHAVDPNVKVIKVRASRGKKTRAEPVSTLYEQGRVHHVGTIDGAPDEEGLETQMCEWVPGEGDSPDRVDAVVWGITELLDVGQKRKKKVRILN